MANVYFDLTREFNRAHPVAALSSGQAVVYYRVAIMSKDGDWIVRETPEACAHVRSVLASRGARYRPSAPLDVRWLRGGWSSHFEYVDQVRRRIRCDFVSRPPRVSGHSINALFRDLPADGLLVVDYESLIRMKQTARLKDYAIIGELSRRLPAEQELELTTDVDRILDLVASIGEQSARPSVRAARNGAPRAAVVAALAQEVDALQQADRRRLSAYRRAAEQYLTAFHQRRIDTLPLGQAHDEACRLAETLLPTRPDEQDT